MRLVSGLVFLCVAVSVDRCLAQEEDCDCTVYYLCDAANTIQSSKCNSPEVCCKPTSPTASNVVTAPPSRNGGPSKDTTPADDGGEPNCVCVPAIECPQVSGANQLNIRFGKTCSGKNQVCCPKEGASGSNGDTIEPNGDGDRVPLPGPDPNTSDQFQECGFRKLKLANRISGQNAEQTDTFFGEFPWMMAILTTRTNKDGSRTENVFSCGATLILPHVVMTAAHCVNNLPVGDIKVRGGDWDTVSDNQTDREPFRYEERTVSQIYIHQDFEPATVYNDIALIVLDFPFPVKDHIGQICTPNSADEYDENKCIVTGWGKDKFGVEGHYQSILKKVDLKIVPRNTCQQKLRLTRLGGQFKLHDSFICASGGPGQDACKGDGGGPLICEMKGEPGRYTQVGIVAWGIGCNSDTPGVYVDVRKYKRWILDNSHGTVIDTRIRKKN